jgi:hypothetical protein
MAVVMPEIAATIMPPVAIPMPVPVSMTAVSPHRARESDCHYDERAFQ